MVAPLYTTASGLLFHAGKILVCTVGLPARGKTHISRALERYLRWTGVKTAVISLGDYRRKVLGGAQKLPPDYFTLGMLPVRQGTKVLLKWRRTRRKEPRNDCPEREGLVRMRTTHLGLLQLWRAGRHLRRQQRDTRTS